MTRAAWLREAPVTSATAAAFVGRTRSGEPLAGLRAQFEFLQDAWMANTKFSGLDAESDPLVGNREPIAGCPVTDRFTVQRDGALPRRVSGLPRFVTVRGGACFLAPGLRALRYRAGG